MTKDKLLDTLCTRYPVLSVTRDPIADASGMIIRCYTRGRKLLICGNGGSSADSEHMAAELMKGFEYKRPLDESLITRLSGISPDRGKFIGGRLEHALPAISLSSNHALITAVSNDMDPGLIFAQQVIGFGMEGDILFGISTSGNSQSVVDACITARALNLEVIGLTGRTGGIMKQYCDILVNVPEEITAFVQELNLPVMHTICRIVENHFYGKKKIKA